MPAVMVQSKTENPITASQVAFAQMLLNWRDQQKLTWKRITAISTLANQHETDPYRYVSNTYLSTLQQIANGAKTNYWKPDLRLFDGLESLFRFLEQVNSGEVKPSLPYRGPNGQTVTKEDVMGKRGLLDEDGSVLSADELIRIFTGKRLPPLCSQVKPETLEALAPAFGRALDRILVQQGLSPIRDLPLLLKHYPKDPDKLRRVLMDEDQFSATELDEALPFIALALHKASGRNWTLEDVVAAAVDISSSSSSR